MADAPGRPHRVVGWRCAVCGARRGISDVAPWRCPNSTLTDRHHVLERVEGPPAGVTRDGPGRTAGSDGSDVSDGSDASGRADRATASSVLAHDHDLAWAAFAASQGIDADGRARLFAEIDDALADTERARFVPTPLRRHDDLSAALGFTGEGGIWVKDETAAVGGSHKARHLLTILLHLRAAEVAGRRSDRPPLAIASCGNAAIAAATLARAAAWPIDVFVPTWMSDAVGDHLVELGASVHRCAREGVEPAGDPAMHGFRGAVEHGAIPFTVQGPENALCLDGGRTLGWEAVEQLDDLDGGRFDRAFVQVGGGAFAATVGAALRDRPDPPRLHAVQAEGCAPLARAWSRADGRTDLAPHWGELMTVWSDPHSAADGIVDDETYDWLGVVDAMRATGGGPVVAPEADILRAHRLMVDAGLPVSVTGSAGLAGVLAARDAIADAERILVVASGVAR